MRREDGFTLIELLVVILIIAILAAIAIPVFLRQRDKGREAQVRSALKNAAIAIESYYVEHGTYDTLNANPHLRTKLEPEGFPWPEWADSGRLTVNRMPRPTASKRNTRTSPRATTGTKPPIDPRSEPPKPHPTAALLLASSGAGYAAMRG